MWKNNTDILLDLAKNLGILPVPFFPMHLLEDPSLAVPDVITYHHLDHALDGIEEHLCKEMVGSLRLILRTNPHTLQARSLSSAADRDVIETMRLEFSRIGLDLDEYFSIPTVDDDGIDAAYDARQNNKSIRIHVEENDIGVSDKTVTVEAA